MNEILDQIKQRGFDSTVIDWFERRYPAGQEAMSLTEGEHILDWIEAKKPKKLGKMTWAEALVSANKWTKAQQKKGEHIIETESDTVHFMRVGEFEIVQLVGENAFKREGFLMNHCVASYHNKTGTKVYSLRDKNNQPHATFEVVGENQIQQIKGKGNGPIHPNYIEAVVLFLEKLGMPVRDSEMLNLGYVNLEKLLPEIANKKEIENLFFKEKYFPKNKREELKDENGEVLNHIGLLDYFPLIEETGTKLKIAFNLPTLFSGSIEWIKKSCKNKIDNNKVKTADDSNKIAADDSNQIAANNYNKIAADNSNKIAADDSNQIAANNSNKIAADDSNQIAANNSNKIAADNSNKIAADDSNKIAADNYNQIAANDSNQIAANNYNKIAADNSNKIAADDSNQIAANNSNKIAADNSNKIVCNYSNEITLNGSNNVVVAGPESKFKGKKGSLIVLFDKNNDGEIIDYVVKMIDGIEICEDTWYKLEKGKFVVCQ